MAQPQNMTASEIAAEHAAESHVPYITIWAYLAVLTAIEYVYALAFQEWISVPFLVLLLGLLFLAAVKAGLVGWFFMHLKFEGPWVYIMIIPACILAAILVCALMPDISFKPETEENAEEETVWIAPAREGSDALFPRPFAERVPEGHSPSSVVRPAHGDSPPGEKGRVTGIVSADSRYAGPKSSPTTLSDRTVHHPSVIPAQWQSLTDSAS
jgi:cytochrome c oxidase subunit 4